MTVTLRDITDANRDAVLALHTTPAQERFVSTVAGSLRQAEVEPEAKPWFRAVYADDQPVGFVMLSWDVVPDPPELNGPWFLWKLLIDQRHQRRGYGRQAVHQVVQIVRDHGGTELLTSYVLGEGNPFGFYSGLGFVPRGDVDTEGEIILQLDLRTSPGL